MLRRIRRSIRTYPWMRFVCCLVSRACQGANMNKPATKDPSMDEILSSIRQIIADDDAPEGEAAAQPEASAAPSEADADAQMAALATQEAPAAPAEDVPLELSAEQMVGEPEVSEEPAEEELPNIDFNPASSGLDVAVAEEPEPEPAVASQAPAEDVGLVVADDISFEGEESPEEVVEPEPAPASTMPDPDLSTDMANKLLAPTTDAAVRHTFSKLTSVAVGGSELTFEAMVREMLRPMLKEWLDEHLPATVERMVEKEIERVSRGE
ncbi:MAG TPA: DUF2497 domain-containing protein [Devosia sp.]|nr:DUF2497 domain-containing protein [Devosia sp.]